MTARAPISGKIAGLRQRQRSDGTWRVWWEPNASARSLNFAAVELDPDRATWSVRQAKQLNLDVERARRGETSRPTTAGGRTVDALIHDYRHSRMFQRLADKTRSGYDINLNAIARKWGGRPVAEFTKPVLRTWYETLHTGSGPAQAQALIRMFSILFSHAEMMGWRPENSNPCFRLKMDSVRRRSRSATWAEFDALLTAADRLGHHAMACGIALATLTAQRQTDIINAAPGDFRRVTVGDGGDRREVWAWELIRSKKDNYGIIALHDEVAWRVTTEIQSAADDQSHLLIDEATGRPYSGDLFRKRWAAIRALAAKSQPSLRDLQFRDLRRTFAVWARAGGGLKEDIGDVLGNSAALDPQLGETYMPPSFHTAARAIQAVRRPDPEKRKKA